MACLSLFYKSYVDIFSPASYLMSIHYTSRWLLFLYFTSSNQKVASLSLFFRLYVACLSLFYKSYVDTFSLVSYLMSIHHTSRWLLFLYFTSSDKRWTVYLCSPSYMWHVYLHFQILCGYFLFSILLYVYSLYFRVATFSLFYLIRP